MLDLWRRKERRSERSVERKWRVRKVRIIIQMHTLK